MRVTILGHASLFFEFQRERILLDPILRTSNLLGSAVHQYPRTLEIDNLPQPTLLIITHQHYDHFDPQTLKELSKKTPVMIPPDQKLEQQLSSIGFGNIRCLETWERAVFGSVRLTATPSEADVTEFGLLLETDDARMWHMSDAEPPEGTSDKLLSTCGPLDVVSVKYQPPDPLLNFVHNLGASFDRKSTAFWLETACACKPKLAFPYASGLCLEEDYAWMNRYAYPFSPEYVSTVLQNRLGPMGRSTVVRPGDVISMRNGQVEVESQASPFVRQSRAETFIEWEPIEAEYLKGTSDASNGRLLRDQLAELIESGEFGAWLEAHPQLLKPFYEWAVLCQFAVHVDGTQRMYFKADFTTGTPKTSLGRSSAANYFMHIGGDAAAKILSGRASSAELIYQGSVRIFERIVSVRNEKVVAPASTHMYGEFPDPFLCFANARARLARTAMSKPL